MEDQSISQSHRKDLIKARGITTLPNDLKIQKNVPCQIITGRKVTRERMLTALDYGYGMMK